MGASGIGTSGKVSASFCGDKLGMLGPVCARALRFGVGLMLARPALKPDGDMPILLRVYAEKRLDARRSNASRDLSARSEGSDPSSSSAGVWGKNMGSSESIVGSGDRRSEWATDTEDEEC